MIKRYLLFLISIWTSMMLYAQVNVNLRGQVLDENDLGLMGVNVSVKGSSRGIITDIDGNFSLASLSQKDVLVFSFVGYETQEVLVGNRHRINVHLKPLVSELNDVVVVAYGAQKKATLTGALSTGRCGETDGSAGGQCHEYVGGCGAGCYLCADFRTARKGCCCSIYPWCGFYECFFVFSVGSGGWSRT